MSMFPKEVSYGVAITALLIALTLSVWTVRTTFTITARTESLSLVTGLTPLRWHLRDARVYRGFDGKGELFTGGIDLEPGSSVSFERIALGPLRIRAEATHPGMVVATLLDVGDEKVEELRGRVVFRVDDPSGRASRGEAIVIPFIGHLEIGREIALGGGEAAPLLREGKIAILGHSWFGDSRFDGGSVTLDPGDCVRIQGADEVAGLVVVNEEPAFTAVARAVGDRARVSRFASQGYEVATPVPARIRHDPVVQGTWATALFLAALFIYAARRREGSSQ